MANIMLTERCNLKCPYCFADEFVNKENTNISLENFSKALMFAMSGKHFSGRIGLIGGEPTLHPQFREILQILQEEERVTNAVIFTNGIRMDETFDITKEDKYTVLINLNSPDDIGKDSFEKIQENTDIFVNRLNKRRFLTVGLNLYKPDMDCSFYKEFLRRFDVHTARLSITVPNHSQSSGFERFYEMKRLAYDLYVDLLYDGREVIFDCNMPPYCVWTEEEMKKISLIQSGQFAGRRGFTLGCSECHPVIDILPDLTAVRCFGMSDSTKVKLSDFKTVDQLYKYYMKTADSRMVKIPSLTKCGTCTYFRKKQCYGGCLASKNAQ